MKEIISLCAKYFLKLPIFRPLLAFIAEIS